MSQAADTAGPSQRGPDDPTVTSERRRGAAPPPVLERYKILAPLGHGGTGAVYEASDELLGRRVAIKLLHRRDAGTTPAGQRRAGLLREAQALAKLNHPNVVSVYDVGTVHDDVFLCMELVRGTTLKDYLKTERADWREVLALFDSAAQGLAAAHAAGLVHRDFKPSNVLLGDDGRVLVSDFGLARAASTDGAPAGAAGAESTTLTGPAEGTPRYMAPEQRAGAEVTAASDQFSLCVALYEALYHRHPFDGGASAAPPPADTAVPAAVGTAIARGLADDPAERHHTVDDLRAALRSAQPAPRRRTALAAAAGVAAAAAVLGWLVWRPSPPSPTMTRPAARPELRPAIEATESGALPSPDPSVMSGARAAISEAVGDRDDPAATVEAHFVVANQLQIEGRDREALEIVRDGLERQIALLGPEAPAVAQTEFWLAYLYVRVGVPAGGIDLAAHATTVAEASGDLSATAEARALWARCLYEAGRVDEGIAQGARALEEAEQSGNTDLATRIRTYGKTNQIE